MLRVFVYLGGGPEHIEIEAAPAGQALVSLKEGRKAHFWWTAEDMAKLSGGGAVLRCLVPNVDRVWVGRDFGPGQLMQPVFDGTIVESAYDLSMVSFTGVEPPRQVPYPPIPGGGMREPLREPLRQPPTPAPAPTPPPAQPPTQAPVPTQSGDARGGRLELFTQPRQGVAPVPLGQPVN